MRHKTLFSRPLSGSRTVTVRSPRGVPGKVDKICGGHGQGETPGPIPNPEAKALHGDGTAPERVWESSAPPLSHDTDPRSSPLGLPGVSRFPPTHARAGRATQPRTPRTQGHPLPISLYLFIHSFLLSRSRPPFYSFVPPPVSSPLSPPFLSLLSCPSFLPFPTSPAFLRPRPATSLLSFLRHRLFPSPAASPRFLFALSGDSRIPAFCLFRSSSAIIGFWNSL